MVLNAFDSKFLIALRLRCCSRAFSLPIWRTSFCKFNYWFNRW